MIDFNKDLNISYIDEENTKPATNYIIIKHYICSLIVYGTVLLFYFFCPFFSNLLSDEVKTIYVYLYKYYIFIAPLIYFFYRPKSIWISHNIEICNYIQRLFSNLLKFKILSIEDIKQELENLKPTYREQQSLMLIFIKMFFGAIMVQGLWTNCEYFHNHAPELKKIGYEIFNAIITLNNTEFWTILKQNVIFLHNNILIALFTIDLSIFAIGYLTELSLLKNKIRTVETTPAGILFCLACYPPFVYASFRIFDWQRCDNMSANDILNPFMLGLRILGLILISIYVCASIALWTKGSNLTNRGIVSRFPYNIVRHPAYISKCTFWIISTIPFLVQKFYTPQMSLHNYLLLILTTLLAGIFWTTIYYMRALTEERHLIKDPEYQEYVKKVKYRFIPGII